MNRYNFYKAEDFVWDEAFRNWVLLPTPETSKRWGSWLAANPGMSNPVQAAREVVLALQCRGPTLTDAEVKQRVRQTLAYLTETP